jgi:hypothetical protein
MRKLVIVAALLSGVAVTPAKADILAAASRASQTQVSDGLPLPVFETGTTNLSFKTTVASQRVKISYNVTCYTFSAGVIRVRITIDGKPTSPDINRVLCGQQFAGAVYDNGTVQATTIVPKTGTHNVVVIAYQDRPGTDYVLGTSLVVEK